jgi:hypothetical protein
MTSLRGYAGREPLGREEDCNASPGERTQPTSFRHLGVAEIAYVARTLAWSQVEAAGIAPASPTQAARAVERQIRDEASPPPHANVRAPPLTLVMAKPSARTPCLAAESSLKRELAVSRKQDDAPWRGIRIREADHFQHIYENSCNYFRVFVDRIW